MHPGTGVQIVTIIEGLMGYGEKNGFKPFLVHRLDKHTSGILVTAKNPEWARIITKLFKNHDLKKKYFALVKNNSNFNNQKVFTENENGFMEKSIVNTIRNFKSSSLLEVELLTGKKHQIRRQLSNLKFPIIGDDHYGDKQFNNLFRKKTGLKRYFLHCHYLSFSSPSSPEDIKKFEFKSPLPDDLKIVINKIDAN